MKTACVLLPFSSNFLQCLPLQWFRGSLPRSSNICAPWAFKNPDRLNITWSSSQKRSRDIKISTTRLGLIIVNPLLGWTESDLQRALTAFFRLSILLNVFHKVRIMQGGKGGHWLRIPDKNYQSPEIQKEHLSLFREETVGYKNVCLNSQGQWQRRVFCI